MLVAHAYSRGCTESDNALEIARYNYNICTFANESSLVHYTWHSMHARRCRAFNDFEQIQRGYNIIYLPLKILHVSEMPSELISDGLTSKNNLGVYPEIPLACVLHMLATFILAPG